MWNNEEEDHSVGYPNYFSPQASIEESIFSVLDCIAKAHVAQVVLVTSMVRLSIYFSAAHQSEVSAKAVVGKKARG